MSDNQSTHPSSMTEADVEALRASDPSAFDDDAPPAGDPAGGGEDAEGGAEAGTAASGGEGEGEGGAAAAADAGADAAGAAAQDTTTAAQAAEGGAEGDRSKAPPAMVPKDRLDEVIDQRNHAEQLSTQQAVELEQLRAKVAALEAPKDYEAEYLAIEKRYDDGDLDDAQKAAEIRKVWREEQADITRRTTLTTQTETLEAVVQRSWEDEVAAFTKRNPGFLEVEGNADVFQRALNSTAAFHGNTISQAELLNKAGKLAFEYTGYKPPAAAQTELPPGSVVVDPAAARRKQNAARASDAAATPPPIAGGVGERGGPGRGVDLENLKPGTFSTKLSVEEQEKLLGPGAV